MSNGLKQDISIGKNLKLLRKKAHFTQYGAAMRLSEMGIPMTENILSKIEQGRYTIKISVLLAFKTIYHVSSFDDFFDGIGKKQS